MHRSVALLLAFAAEAARASKIPLHQLGDASVYGVSVSIGEPAQNFTLLLSIMQPLLWVPSKRCADCNFLKVTPYDHDTSTSYVKDGRNFMDAVTSGTDSIDSVQGFLSRDDVSVVGPDAVTATQLSIGETTEARLIDIAKGWDGVLGLGRGGDVNENLVLALAAENKILRPVVGIWLDARSGRKGVGELSFGRADAAKFVASTLKRYPVMPPPAAVTDPRMREMWRVPLDGGVSVNGGHFDTVSQTVGVVLNTASPYIYLPDKELEAFAISVGAFQVYNAIAVHWNSTLNLTFHFSEGQQITVTAKDLLMDSLFGKAFAVLPLLPLSQASGLPQDCGWILGTTFMSKVYTVLDFGDDEQGPSVSLAERSDNMTAAGSTDAVEGQLKMPLVNEVPEAMVRSPQEGGRTGVTTPEFV